MANDALIFLKGSSSTLSSKPKKAGQYLVCEDTGEIYLDIDNQTRRLLSDPVELAQIRKDLDSYVAKTSVSNSAPTLEWNTTSTIGTVGGISLTAKLPENPNTDTKVTGVENHYTPMADSTKTLSVDASSTTAASWGVTDLITGVNIQRDAAGHVTGITADSIQMPSDRLFTTLVPTGTSIPAKADLNTTTYLKVGRYFCSKNTDAATLTNSPLSVAFMMEVSSPLSTTIDNETTKTWVYRLRKITAYNTGVQYVQYCYVGGTANSWSYGDWYTVPRSKFTLDATDKNGGSATVGSDTKPVYVTSDGTITACTHTLKTSVPSDAVFTDTTYTFATGDGNGQIKVTPAGGTAQNISVKGLGTAAYTASTAYDAAGAADTALTNAKTYTNTVAAGKADKTQGIYYVEGSGTTDTTNKVAAWTGSHDDITEYYNGLMIAYKIGIAGSTTTTLNINNLGAVTVVKNASSAISTNFAVNSVIFLVYTTDDSTAYWKAHDYDANTRNSVGDYRKNGTKLYFVGTTSSDSSTSSSYATSYTNSNVYVTTDNVLYSASGFQGNLVGNADTATSATSATKATQDASGNVIISTYETKTAASTKLAEAKTYTDNAVAQKTQVQIITWGADD